MNAIGINVYGGGFTLGVLKHFSVLGQWEEITLGAKTFDLNFKIPRPLNASEWPIKDCVGKVDLVYANPPCAPWSSANTRPGQNINLRFLDSRLALTASTMAAAIKLRPTVFISESVENAFNHGVSFYDPYADMWIKEGYEVTYFLTDAILHGSPSCRRRFHFIASLVQLDFKPPKVSVVRTVRDAIGDLTVFNAAIQHTHRPHELEIIMPLCKPGGKLIDAVHSKYKGPRPSFLCKRFLWDAPSHTMVNFNFVHPDGTRFITTREALRLCTYPDSFRCHTPIEAVDAVLPVVAEYLAKKAKVGIRKGLSSTPGLSIIDWRPLGLQFHPRNYLKKNLQQGLIK